MTNKQRLALAVFVSALFFSAVAIPRIYSPRLMDDSQWVGIVLKNEYGIENTETISDAFSGAALMTGEPVALLVSISAVESNFNHLAHSPCHAIGYMQVRPDVWSGKQPYSVYDRYENIFAGAHILHEYAVATGSMDGAIRAYNIGITKFQEGRAKAAAERYHKKVIAVYDRINKRYPRQIDTE